MKKKFYASKTLWGIVIAGIVATGQILGVGYSENAVAELVKIIGLALGAFGIRDALD